MIPLLAAILLPFSAFATTPAGVATADVSFTQVFVKGDLEHHTSDLAAMVAPPHQGGSYAWNLTAKHLVVNWTRTTFVEHGKPSNPSERGGQVENGPRSYGEIEFGPVAGSALSRGGESNLLVDAGLGAAAVVRAPQSVEAIPVRNASWVAGRDASLANPTGQDPTSFKFTLPPGLIEMNGNQSGVQITGNFSVYVWDSEVRVADANGTQTFNSGSWVSLSPTGGQWAVWERKYQLLRLEVTDGSFQLSFNKRAARWAAREALFEGNVSATFQDAQGFLQHGTTNQSIAHEPITLVGTGTLIVWNETGPLPRLRAHFELDGGTATSLQTIQLDPPSKRPQSADPPRVATGGGVGHASPWWWLAAAGLLVPAALLAARRVDPPNPDITDVEWAILMGHPRRARRWSRRLVQREPGSPDAVFLYGSTLLADGRFAEIRDTMETLANDLAPEQRRGVAFILAVASKKLGDERRLDKWGSEAAQEPVLRARLEGDGIFKSRGPTASGTGMTAYV